MRRQAGAALLLVLWLIALLTALVGVFALTARIEALQAKSLSGGLQAREIARAGVEYALLRLTHADPATRWAPDGRIYRWSFAGAELEIAVVDETGKVDLNQAPAPLLASLLRALGLPRGQAERLAANILDWRDGDSLTQVGGGAEDRDYAAAGLPYGAKDAAFESLAEVEQVLGMSPAIFTLLEPHVTLSSGRAQPDASYAQDPVLLAMGLDPALQAAQRVGTQRTGGPVAFVASGSGTYSISSRARLADGRQAALRALVRAGPGAVPGSAYTVLGWQEGMTSR
ncbi:MAG: general secretion pathway protein GspK [Pseudoxanthomonas sp.]|nr:general secretion pathway protein GspK [Pseudoxanthomonas sp.]